MSSCGTAAPAVSVVAVPGAAPAAAAAALLAKMSFIPPDRIVWAVPRVKEGGWIAQLRLLLAVVGPDVATASAPDLDMPVQ